MAVQIIAANYIVGEFGLAFEGVFTGGDLIARFTLAENQPAVGAFIGFILVVG